MELMVENETVVAVFAMKMARRQKLFVQMLSKPCGPRLTQDIFIKGKELTGKHSRLSSLCKNCFWHGPPLIPFLLTWKQGLHHPSIRYTSCQMQ